MISKISFICSFKISKVNLFPSLTAPFPLAFPSNIVIAFEDKLLDNPDKLSLAKEITTFVSAYFRYLSSMKFYICCHIISKGIPYFSCLCCC